MADEKLNSAINLNENERNVLNLIKSNPSITKKDKYILENIKNNYRQSIAFSEKKRI